MKKLLKELSNENDRAAQFRTVIALVDGGQTTYFEGKVRGQIALEISGAEGFGYDPIFIPDGYESTFAELSSDVKNTISHRARAVSNLLLFFDQFTLSNQ